MNPPNPPAENPAPSASDPLPSPPPATNTLFNAQFSSFRRVVTFSDREFNTKTLPPDMQRVYGKLAAAHGREYALTFAFVVRTAVELHRAWNMTLMTSMILQDVKNHSGLRMTWELGVVKLKFRVEEGTYELHRKVPYDYDSEFQDYYRKIASALIEGHITIDQALIFQSETKVGRHTAPSGLFLRENPGRLVLYPLQAATCALIFFGGDWIDAGVAAVCGLAAGLTEHFLNVWARSTGAVEAKVLVDFIVGMVTGIVTGIFYLALNGGNNPAESELCLPAIFLGTLYWFFYGTAFVIGLLEIISGELATGVTRFISVSVKTFVLALGSSIGLMMITNQNGTAYDVWGDAQDAQCGNFEGLDKTWLRIAIYLVCSVSVLGQYRFPVADYWRGLVVQLVGYEVQYIVFNAIEDAHKNDFLDTAASNVAGAASAVLVASFLSVLVNEINVYYNSRLLRTGPLVSSRSAFGNLLYKWVSLWVRFVYFIGLGKLSALKALNMEKKLAQNAQELLDPSHVRTEIRLTPEEEEVLVEAIVDAGDISIWSLLMPAVYQLVPGSLIAKLWYAIIFPPLPLDTMRDVEVLGINYTYKDVTPNPLQTEASYGLWVVSTSLALGLLVGSAFVHLLVVPSQKIFFSCKKGRSEKTEEDLIKEKRRDSRLRFLGVMAPDTDDDPDGMENDKKYGTEPSDFITE